MEVVDQHTKNLLRNSTCIEITTAVKKNSNISKGIRCKNK